MAAHPVARMALAALGCCAVVMGSAGGRSPLAVLLGMAGPLVAAIGSWVILARVRARAPEHVSGAMIKLFGAKMLLIGAYVSFVILFLPSGKTFFVVSFVSHYILLHVMEAVYLRRLFSVGDVDGGRLSVS